MNLLPYVERLLLLTGNKEVDELRVALADIFRQFTLVPLGCSTINVNGLNIYAGNGAPTFAAAKGSLYLRYDGGGVNSRAYINTNGSTTWTAIVTVA